MRWCTKNGSNTPGLFEKLILIWRIIQNGWTGRWLVFAQTKNLRFGSPRFLHTRYDGTLLLLSFVESFPSSSMVCFCDVVNSSLPVVLMSTLFATRPGGTLEMEMSSGGNLRIRSKSCMILQWPRAINWCKLNQRTFAQACWRSIRVACVQMLDDLQLLSTLYLEILAGVWTAFRSNIKDLDLTENLRRCRPEYTPFSDTDNFPSWWSPKSMRR
jgi:hypothetical protein